MATTNFISETTEAILNQIDPDNNVDKPSTKAYFSIYDYAIPAIGVLIIVTNLAVVISSGLILKKGQQPRSTYLFLGNVAMTDLITGIAVVFGQVYPIRLRDHNICALQIGMIVSSTLASVYSVGLIAIDRFLYILYGMKYAKWVYPTRARLLISFTWIIGGVIGFLPLMGWSGHTNNGKICWFILLAPKELILLTVIMGVIPILVVLILYSIILFQAIKRIHTIQQSEKNRPEQSIYTISNNPENSTKNLRMFRGRNNPEHGKPASTVSKWKAIKVVLFTTMSFLITWSPYFIVSIIYVYSCDFQSTDPKCQKLRILIASPLAILGFMNSFLNPIIYAWWHKGFRKFAMNKLRKISMRKTTVSITNSSSNSKDRVKRNEISVSSGSISDNSQQISSVTTRPDT